MYSSNSLRFTNFLCQRKERRDSFSSEAYWQSSDFTKNVVKLRLEGYRNVEIAELCTLPRGTVHSQLVYARYKLRKKITEYYSQNRK